MIHLIKYVFTVTLVLLSSIAFAANLSIPTIQLDPIVVPAGGNTHAEISLQPIKDYTRSRWDINCSITNPSISSVIIKFGISRVDPINWPQALLNESYLNMDWQPQGLLNPGENTYLLLKVDNKGFNTLQFINFDTDQDISITCFARPSVG